MKLLRNLIGLMAMMGLHIVVQQFLPSLGRVLDPFVVWVVLQGLSASPLRGMSAGLVAGWCEDALSGESLFGLHGVAGTIVGYLVAQATRQLSTTSLPVVGLLFAVAAALHEALLMALQMLLSASPATLDPTWVGLRALVNGCFGVLLLGAGEKAGQWGQEFRQSRKRRIRFDI
jgi:rod shape-determining protein MreD